MEAWIQTKIKLSSTLCTRVNNRVSVLFSDPSHVVRVRGIRKVCLLILIFFVYICIFYSAASFCLISSFSVGFSFSPPLFSRSASTADMSWCLEERSGSGHDSSFWIIVSCSFVISLRSTVLEDLMTKMTSLKNYNPIVYLSLPLGLHVASSLLPGLPCLLS